MILTGDKVSVGTNGSNIIDFLTKPRNLEHLLPMDKVKDFVCDETSCSFKVQEDLSFPLSKMEMKKIKCS